MLHYPFTGMRRSSYLIVNEYIQYVLILRSNILELTSYFFGSVKQIRVHGLTLNPQLQKGHCHSQRNIVNQILSYSYNFQLLVRKSLITSIFHVQVTNHQPYDSKADVYGLALVLCHLMTSKVFILSHMGYLQACSLFQP